jgi:hypothetical protein
VIVHGRRAQRQIDTSPSISTVCRCVTHKTAGSAVHGLQPLRVRRHSGNVARRRHHCKSR